MGRVRFPSVTGPAWREAALDALEHERFDLLVIGGGINGAGIARDAALRGLKVAVVEQSDFASGTSSRSSKLIHGGLRYLEQGEIRLVLESTRERERLRRLAPHLVRPMRFVYPIYAAGPVSKWKLAAGLWAYDILAGIRSVHLHRMLGADAAHRAEPGLLTDGLRGAGVYWDCWTDDARLVLETLLSARAAGAVAVSYARVIGFVKESGRLVGVRGTDRLGGRELTGRGRAGATAAGATRGWGEGRGRAGPAASPADEGRPHRRPAGSRRPRGGDRPARGAGWSGHVRDPVGRVLARRHHGHGSSRGRRGPPHRGAGGR